MRNCAAQSGETDCTPINGFLSPLLPARARRITAQQDSISRAAYAIWAMPVSLTSSLAAGLTCRYPRVYVLDY